MGLLKIGIINEKRLVRIGLMIKIEAFPQNFFPLLLDEKPATKNFPFGPPYVGSGIGICQTGF